MNESRLKKSTRNIVFIIISQIIKFIFVYVTRIIFVKCLGETLLGINGLFTNVLSILCLADMGITTAMMYSLYKPISENDEIQISKYINYFKSIYRIIALFIFVTGLLLIPFLKYIINLPTDIKNIYLYYFLFLLNTVISYLFVYKTTLLIADQKNYIINIVDTIFQFLLFIFQLISIVIYENFVFYLISGIICTFVGNVIKAKYTEIKYPYLIKNKNLVLDTSEKNMLKKNIGSLFFYKLGGIIQSNTDNILISIYIGTIMVGKYSNYNTLILQTSAFIYLIFNALKSSVGSFNIKKDKNDKLWLYNVLDVFNNVIIGFVSILLLLILSDFIELSFGKKFILDECLIIMMILNFYTSNIRQTLWIYRETSGIFTKTKYITLVTAIINLLSSIVLGKLFGFVGILSATVISRMLYAWWKEPIIIYNNIFGISSKMYFVGYINNLLELSIIYIFIKFIFSYFTFSSILVKIVVKVIIILIIMIIYYYIKYRKSDAFKYMKKILN